ncbi:hypothetical protein [Paucibacter sp. DJ2R-2]|uniref:hypothetical protein n=1 Tax=Paucibacter sp. DJ2R-2 TaxID=2893558 RepID=UPI0021E3B73C|nr:hypothetical protein [Paucibacter sp. DJ2R-2]MCV2419174.1 hypothetical protein [Paucibacter sp. DJ4R-1]MCV2437871.1 hypothetical protein [Paucibacter sp. DJ2R-2]
MNNSLPTDASDLPSAKPDTSAVPRLWNPNAAASWSLIFSPIFGALLQRSNWLAMGHPDKAAGSLRWVWASLGFLGVSLISIVCFPDSKTVDLLMRIAGFVFLVAWYYANGKEQVGLVLARYGRDYPRKSWWHPLGLALLAMVGLMLIAGLLGLVASLISGEG